MENKMAEIVLGSTGWALQQMEAGERVCSERFMTHLNTLCGIKRKPITKFLEQENHGTRIMTNHGRLCITDTQDFVSMLSQYNDWVLYTEVLHDSSWAFKQLLDTDCVRQPRWKDEQYLYNTNYYRDTEEPQCAIYFNDDHYIGKMDETAFCTLFMEMMWVIY
jgi:hypothetical protein